MNDLMRLKKLEILIIGLHVGFLIMALFQIAYNVGNMGALFGWVNAIIWCSISFRLCIFVMNKY